MGRSTNSVSEASLCLIRAREKARLSQFEVSVRTAIQTPTLSRYENGEPIAAKHALRLARFFELPVETFYDDHLSVQPFSEAYIHG